MTGGSWSLSLMTAKSINSFQLIQASTHKHTNKHMQFILRTPLLIPDTGHTWVRSISNDNFLGLYRSGIASSSDGLKLAVIANGSRICTSSDVGVACATRPSGRRYCTTIACCSDGEQTYRGGSDERRIYPPSSDSGSTWTEDSSLGGQFSHRHWFWFWW